jgi:hypothetical protein
MEACWSLPLAETGRGPGEALRQETKNGEATLANAAARKNWRRDQGAEAEDEAAGLVERGEGELSFIPAA